MPVHPTTASQPAKQLPPWTTSQLLALYTLPLPELLFQAQQAHRQHHAPDQIQLSTLLSIKTGGCAEDCSYCPQSARYDTGVQADKLLPLDTVLQAARQARDAGAQRFCMGAAWRNPKPRDMAAVTAMVQGVKALGLETCMTLGMLEQEQADQLADAGLDYYNHNLDTAPAFYGNIVTTRTYGDRLDTLARVREAGIHVCCGGIVGMGESRRDRMALIAQLAALDPYPESVPINALVPIPGTPLADMPPMDPFDFVRTIAVARIAMPRAMVRLSAGREALDDAAQALCFMAGANSIFYGEQLLTSANPQQAADRQLLARLGMQVAGATNAAACTTAGSPS